MTPSARGLTHIQVECMRLALHNILADEENPRSLTARIMRENDITSRDVMRALDVVTDVLDQHRLAEMEAGDATQDVL